MNASKDIDKYIDGFPNETKVVLEKIRKIIHREVPEAEEIISYKIPAFRLNKRNFIYFAGWKNHVSIYPIPELPGDFIKEIEPFVAGRGTLKFPLDKPVPYELIEKFVQLSLKAIQKKNSQTLS